MTLKKVTSWSAETFDGAIYAETDSRGVWTVHRLRGKGRGALGSFRSLKAANAFLAVPA